MPNFDHNATRFSAKNALLLAQLCNAAYGTEAEARVIAQQMGSPTSRGSTSCSSSKTPPLSSWAAMTLRRSRFVGLKIFRIG